MLNPVVGQPGELPLDDRLSGDINHRLGTFVGMGSHAGGFATRKDHRLSDQLALLDVYLHHVGDQRAEGHVGLVADDHPDRVLPGPEPS